MWKEYHRNYLTKLKMTSAYEKLVNNWFFVAFFIMLGALALNHWWVIFLVVGFGFWLWKAQKTLFYVSVVIMVIVTIIFICCCWRFQPVMDNEVTGMVVNVESKDHYQTITVRKQQGFFLIYDKTNQAIKLGDIIVVEGEALMSDSARLPKGFDYRAFLFHKKIVGRISASHINVVGHRFCLPMLGAFLKQQIKKNMDEESSAFILAVLLGDDDGFDANFSQAIKDNGILHLFAISGLHISLFVGMLTTLLTRIKIKDNHQIVLITLFLVAYLIVTAFSASVFRAALMWGLGTVNKKAKLRLSSLDVLSLTFMILMIINPFYMYNLGFQLSFLATLVIIIGGPLLENQASVVRLFALSCLCLLFTLPLIGNLNYRINLLSPITNVVFILLFEVIIMPASIITLLIPYLSYLYRPLVRSFKTLNGFFQTYFTLYLPLPKMELGMMIAFYFLMIVAVRLFFRRQPKQIYALLLLVAILGAIRLSSLLKATRVYFLDLPGGEASVIAAPQQQCHAVIDTGTRDNSDLIKFLKSHGLFTIDLLILTHDHDDHNGGASMVFNEINVRQVITSRFDNSISAAHATKVQSNDYFSCGKLSFFVWSPNQADKNINNNSLVFQTTIGDKRFLWMGDAEEAIEQQLMMQNISADIIKIGHHGSKTSSSLAFLTKVSPQIAVIQTGRLTYFGFPDSQTIANLNHLGIKTYRTDQDYSIVFAIAFESGR